MIIKANYIDIFNRTIFPAHIKISNGKIQKVNKVKEQYQQYILPGFIDSHIHIESSMLTPVEFARATSVFGTIAVVSDPHEIANVLGIKGVEFMLENAQNLPFKFYFGAPSCVPATPFETSGGCINSADILSLFEKYDLKFLSEMMNFPGVLADDPEVIKKIEISRRLGKRIDGHAPLLSGKDLEKYISEGITSDHEATNFAEAEEKIKKGMKIQIRFGSAANSFEELWRLIDLYPNEIMFATDDMHPDDLIKGHINLFIKRSLAKGANFFNILNAAIKNPVEHYNLDVGLLRIGDDADFILTDSIDENFNVIETYIKGELIATNGKTLIKQKKIDIINNFSAQKIEIDDIKCKAKGKQIIPILAKNNELLTDKIICEANIKNDYVEPDIENDILKIVNLNRYEKNSKPAVAFIKGFELKKGAIASSIAHDSHNIIAIGTNDDDITAAINLLIESKGGISAVNSAEQHIFELPIAGLMTDKDIKYAAEKYTFLTKKAQEFGTKLASPFMTLAFLALLVIPKLKLSDKGLFDSQTFNFIDVFN